jgi:hypothetical protein
MGGIVAPTPLPSPRARRDLRAGPRPSRIGENAQAPARIGSAAPFQHKEPSMITIDKVLYTARVHTTGGRNGRSTSDDKLLDVALALPRGHGRRRRGHQPRAIVRGRLFGLLHGRAALPCRCAQDRLPR